MTVKNVFATESFIQEIKNWIHYLVNSFISESLNHSFKLNLVVHSES